MFVSGGKPPYALPIYSSLKTTTGRIMIRSRPVMSSTPIMGPLEGILYTLSCLLVLLFQGALEQSLHNCNCSTILFKRRSKWPFHPEERLQFAQALRVSKWARTAFITPTSLLPLDCGGPYSPTTRQVIELHTAARLTSHCTYIDG
jgi:hypothetical protein